MSKKNLSLKAELVRQGIPQKDVAKLVGVSKSMVSAVLNGTKRSARVVEAIKELLKDQAA